MRTRIKLEKVTGVVALAYVVLIPAAGVLVWQRLNQIDEDVTELWKQVGMDSLKAAPRFSMARFGRRKVPTI